MQKQKGKKGAFNVSGHHPKKKLGSDFSPPCWHVRAFSLPGRGAMSISISYGFEEYAESTGYDCEYCHVGPSGGAELTDIEKGYC